MTRISLRVILAVQSRDLISTVRFYDLILTIRYHCARHVGIHVGLRGPAICLHRATSPPWVPRD